MFTEIDLLHQRYKLSVLFNIDVRQITHLIFSVLVAAQKSEK